MAAFSGMRFLRFVWPSLLLLLLALTSLSVGPASVTLAEMFGLSDGQQAEQAHLVLVELRLPRTIMAVLTGATLAVGGAVMQSLFRNPLAEPGLVGVSAGAALGAVAAIALGVTGFLAIGAAGFVGAALATGVAWQFSRGWPGSAGLLLAGVAINALVFSVIGLLIAYSSDAQIRSMTFWSLGSMSRTPWIVAMALLIWLPLCWWWVYRHWLALDALLLGESEADRLGVNVRSLRASLILAMTLTVGPLVAFTGTISFVGLLVPHVVRRIYGSSHQQLLPLAALFGATAVLIADIISRLLVAPAELPVGVVISLIGAPTFLWLLRRISR